MVKITDGGIRGGWNRDSCHDLYVNFSKSSEFWRLLSSSLEEYSSDIYPKALPGVVDKVLWIVSVKVYDTEQVPRIN